MRRLFRCGASLGARDQTEILMPTLLVVDDEKNIRRSLSMILEAEGYDVVTAETDAEAMATINRQSVDLVFLDLLLGDKSGMDVLKELRARGTDCPVIMISGHGTIEHAVEAVKLDAFDFIEKPLSKDKILILARNALDNVSLKRENKALRRETGRLHEMVGSSPALQLLREQIAKVAPTTARVLILGESGTGKELAARAIHDASPRKSKPFIKVNCAAIPEDLIESELFGVVKGAYTGAVADREGKFALAHQGTLFLDEIGDMSLKVQAKVLRALQEGEFEKVGGTKTMKVDVRVITATNKDLKAECQKGNFREDLYFRLSVVPLIMPPLRQRADDLPLLVDHFMQLCCQETGATPRTFSDNAMKIMMSYQWPGNIRELRNVVERVSILSAGNRIEPGDLPEHIVQAEPTYIKTFSSSSGRSLKDVKEEVERAFIQHVMEKNHGNVTKSAAELGIERTNLHKKLKFYNLSSEKFEEGQ
jgi:two-component system nitrogen regulation response regulator NtrX